MSVALAVEGVHFGYGRGPRVLAHVTFHLEAGSFLGIAGPNGAGKTTLLRLLCAEISPQSGRVSVAGTPSGALSITERARRMAVVRQLSPPAFGYTVAETVMMARTLHLGSRGFARDEDRAAVRHALRATDTEGLANRPLMSLSGGERQRVYIARALAQETEMLLLDEPTNFLDPRHQVSVYELLKEAQARRRRTIVTITHDLNLATRYCDTLLLLGGVEKTAIAKEEEGRSTCFIGPPHEVLSEERLQRVYGVRMASGTIEGHRVYLPMGTPSGP